ncbi:MAG: hypothetical protein AAGJ83_09080 [Planctomycetota bacterium]
MKTRKDNCILFRNSYDYSLTLIFKQHREPEVSEDGHRSVIRTS